MRSIRSIDFDNDNYADDNSLFWFTDVNVNGILVQLPLPPHINEHYVLDQIKQEKDVDGLHPLNVAQLANTKTHAPGRSSWSFDTIDFHVSCTPQVVVDDNAIDNDDIDNDDADAIDNNVFVGDDDADDFRCFSFDDNC